MADEEYALVMPFVVVTSQGGPYDDAAFVAGYALGLLDAGLEFGPKIEGHGYRMRLNVRTLSIPQVDLVAMRHGYVVDQLSADEDGWTDVELRKEAPPMSSPESAAL